MVETCDDKFMEIKGNVWIGDKIKRFVTYQI